MPRKVSQLCAFQPGYSTGKELPSDKLLFRHSGCTMMGDPIQGSVLAGALWPGWAAPSPVLFAEWACPTPTMALP